MMYVCAMRFCVAFGGTFKGSRQRHQHPFSKQSFPHRLAAGRGVRVFAFFVCALFTIRTTLQVESGNQTVAILPVLALTFSLRPHGGVGGRLAGGKYFSINPKWGQIIFGGSQWWMVEDLPCFVEYNRTN